MDQNNPITVPRADGFYGPMPAPKDKPNPAFSEAKEAWEEAKRRFTGAGSESGVAGLIPDANDAVLDSFGSALGALGDAGIGGLSALDAAFKYSVGLTTELLPDKMKDSASRDLMAMPEAFAGNLGRGANLLDDVSDVASAQVARIGKAPVRPIKTHQPEDLEVPDDFSVLVPYGNGTNRRIQIMDADGNLFPRERVLELMEDDSDLTDLIRNQGANIVDADTLDILTDDFIQRIDPETDEVLNIPDDLDDIGINEDILDNLGWEPELHPSLQSVTAENYAFRSSLLKEFGAFLESGNFPNKGMKGSQIAKWIHDNPDIRDSEGRRLLNYIDPQKRYSKDELGDLLVGTTYGPRIEESGDFFEAQRQVRIKDPELEYHVLRIRAQDAKLPEFKDSKFRSTFNHFSEDTVAHARVSVRNNEEIGKYLLVEELQSDLIQHGVKSGFAPVSGITEATALSLKAAMGRAVTSGTTKIVIPSVDDIMKAGRFFEGEDLNSARSAFNSTYEVAVDNFVKSIKRKYGEDSISVSEIYLPAKGLSSNELKELKYFIDKATLDVLFGYGDPSEWPLPTELIFRMRDEVPRINLLGTNSEKRAALDLLREEYLKSLMPELIPQKAKLIDFSNLESRGFDYKAMPFAAGGLVGEPEMVNEDNKQQEQTVEEKKLGVLKELAPFFQDALDPSGKLAKEKEKEVEAKPVATSAPVDGAKLNAAPTKQLEQVRSAAAQQPLLLSTLKKDVGMYAAGGLATSGGVDPVSGNQVPIGSTPEEVRDDIPARVSEGEYVIPADVVRYFGVKFFEDLRRQAKSEYTGMESEGRIGGMNPMDDDPDPEDPYELAAKINAEGDEPVKMFLGGLFGKKETPAASGTTTQADIDKVTTGSPFVGNDWSVVGGSVFGQTAGVTYATYTNGKDTVSVPFFNGRNLRPIPHGYWLVGSGQGSGNGEKKDVHSDPRDATYTHGAVIPRSITGSPDSSSRAPDVNLYAMTEEELMNWAKGNDGLLSKGLIGQLMTISRVRAAAKVAADLDYDVAPYQALEQEKENSLGIGADLLDEMIASGEMRYNQQQVYNPKSEQYVDPKTGQRQNAQSGGGGRSAGGGASAETPVEPIPLGNDVEGGKLPAQYDKNGNLMKEVGLRDPAKFTGWSEDTPGTWDDKPAKYVHPDALKIIGEAAQATWGDDLARIIVASGADEHSRNHGKGVPYAAVADVVFVLNDGTVVSEKDPKYLTFAEQAAARGASQIAWGPEYMTNAIHVGINTPGYGDEKTIRGNWASSSAEQADHLQKILNAYHARGPENEFAIPVNYERNIPIAVKTQAELIAEADGVERKRQRLVEEEADAVNRGDGAAAAAAARAREELEAVQGIARKSQYADLPLGMGGEKVITDIEAMPKMAQASGGFSISGDPGMVGRQGFGSPDPELLALAVQEARANGIPERLFVAQIAKESSWNPNTTSQAGAAGLNQFMPATAANYGIDPTDPKQSIPAAAKYMKASYDRWGSWDLALAAYNAGDGAVQKYGGKIPPYEETQNYVAAVNEWADRASWAIEEQAQQPQQTGQQVTGFVGPQGGVPLVTVGDTGLVMQRQTTNSLFNDALKNPNDLFTRAGAGGFDIAHGLGVASVNEDGTASYYEGTAQSPRDPGDHGTSWQGDNSEGLRPVSPVPVYNAEGKLISTELAPDRHVLHDYLRDEAGNVITGWDAARTMHFLDTTGLGLMSSEEMARLEPKANKFPMTIPEGGIYGKTGNPTADVNNGFGKFGLLNPLIVIKEQLGIKPVPATATPIYGDTGVAQAMTDAPWMELQTADSGMGEVFSAKDESKVDVDRTDPLSRALAGETGVSGAGTGFMTKPYAGSTSKDSSPTADQTGVAYTPMSGPISDPVGAAKASPNAVTGSIGGTKVTYTAPPQELKSYTEAEDDLNKDKGFTFGGTSYRKGGLVAKRKPKKRKK